MVKKPKKVSKTKLVLLAVGIAIILALFIGYGISTFYKQPKYDMYCTKLYVQYLSRETCEANGGRWYEPGEEGARPIPVKEGESEGWCDPNYTCSEQYQTYRENYNRNVFVITLIIGIIVLVISIILNKEAVSSGLMGGAILTMIYGTLRYWGRAPDILRFIILGIVLFVLIWVGYRKLNPKK
jgi:hypothetical protein